MIKTGKTVKLNSFGNHKVSKGEEKISSLLFSNNISFEKEKSFVDLKRGNLRFDFYLPKDNIIIEVDGIQHFKYTPHFHKSRHEFLHYKENDRRKNSYCLSHNIELYRIPYWEIDSIRTLSDVFQKKFLVNSKWWNDLLKVP